MNYEPNVMPLIIDNEINQKAKQYEMKKEEILKKQLEEKDKEIERLNNIINGIEKWLKEYIPLLEAGDICEETAQDTLKEVLDKLKSLKEGK